MANYFNTLMKDIMYNSYFQAIFNYPMEWMNLFCCCKKNPKDCLEEIDYKFCVCDSFFLYIFELLLMVALIIIIVFIYLYYCAQLCLCVCLASSSKNNENQD